MNKTIHHIIRLYFCACKGSILIKDGFYLEFFCCAVHHKTWVKRLKNLKLPVENRFAIKPLMMVRKAALFNINFLQWIENLDLITKKILRMINPKKYIRF